MNIENTFIKNSRLLNTKMFMIVYVNLILWLCGLAMWLNLTVGFSGVHCLYLNSYMFFVYLLLLIIFFPPDEYTPIMLLNISAFEMFRIPFAVFLYNLRLKKSIIEDDIQKMLLVDYSNDVIFFLISVVILTAILNFYPINVFVFWHYLLNLPYIY